MQNFYAYLIVGIIVLISIFLILREFFCWYFKTNTMISELQKSLELLQILLKTKKIK